nr:putative ribonuclease H-like domain-containing protein [Tanacetum cinerariifolium]
MSSDTKLTKDEDCETVESTKYRGMIGNLLYLMASRPDIMFIVCLCACFQEAPKTSHLEAIKRIFRCIKGTTHLELWYPKGTVIETIVYADSDHAGDYLDKKSTSSICTFIGCCLTSWFSKKQIALAISKTRVEYVSAKKACQQALWMKQALTDYDIQLDDVSIMCGSKGAIDLSKNLLRWTPKVTLGRLLPHARGLGFKPRRGGFPSRAKKEWGLSPKAKVKNKREKDKIETKPDKNDKRGEARKSQKQSQSSSKLSRDQTFNLTSSTNPTPKGRIRRSSKQKVENSNFERHLPPVATMTDNRTMVEMLRAPTEGCAEAIVQKFDESFHEAWERYKDLLRACPHYSFTELHQLDTFYNALNPAEQDSLNAAAGGNLLEKSPQDALTIIENKYKVRNSRSKPIASPVKACDINSSSEIAKLTHAVNQQTSAVTTAMTAMLKQLQANPPPAPVKAVEEICVTYEGAHPYYQCLATDGNTFLEFRDNIQGYVSAAASNYNQGNPGYRPQGVANQMRPPAMQNQIDMGKNELRNEMKTSIQTPLSNQTNEIKNMMASLLQMNTASTSGSGSLPGNTVANPKGELKAITTRSGLVTDGPTIPTPSKSVTLEEDECVKETYTDPDLAEYTIKVPSHPVKKHKPLFQRNFVLHTRDSPLLNIPYPSRMLKQKQQEKDEIQIKKFWHMFKQLHLNITLTEALVLMPKYQKMLKALLSNKEKFQELANTHLNENCSAVIFKKLLEKLGDPPKFLIPCGFSELKCKALADLRASINLMPLSVWRKLCLPDLIPTRMTLKLANRAICIPDGIARDVFVPVGKPFLRTARALIDVHGEAMILRDGDERLTLNMKHDTASYSNHPHRELVNLINIFNVSSEDCLEVSVSNPTIGNPTFSLHKEITLPKVTHEIHDSEGCNFLSEGLPDIDSFNDIHRHFDDNPLSGSTTYSSNSLLEEFTDELALITYPSDYDDNLKFDIEFDLRAIEFMLYQGKDSDLKDSIDQTDLANLDAYFVDPPPEMFNDEHAPNYSFPLRFDVYDDDFLEIESDAANFSDDPFDSKGEKIKEDNDLPSPNNEDKVFNPEILIQEKSVTIITRVAQENKLAISKASLVFEDFDPPFYEPIVFKDVPNSMKLLPFSSKNEEKVFKPGIYTSEKVREKQEKDKIRSKPNKKQEAEENVQQYVLFPIWSTSFTNPQNTDIDAAFEEKEPKFEERKPESEVNVSPSSSVESKNIMRLMLMVTQFLLLDMPELEDITYSDDDEDVGEKADFTNLETSITVSHILTTKVYKDHLVTQIIGDLSSATQTRSMTRIAKDQGKRAIGTKWVFRNKKDERGIVVRNKARLVRQGHTQGEGIDYKEVFALVARIEAIKLFLACASFMGLTVYQMNIKNAVLYGTIKEEVYVCQPLRFEYPDYPDKIYVDDIIFGSTNNDLCKAFEKLMKHNFQMSSMGELTFFLHLQVKQKPDAIFISHDKYVAEILRKFSLTDGKSASTRIDTEKPLLKDPDGEDVDVHSYSLMIGSLIYLTSSRPNIMFTVCACACFQVTPNISHLHAIKRIFRYLKGKQQLGLWYPKDSPFNLVAYSDSYYAGASLDRKSTSEGCQFLKCRLISLDDAKSVECLPNEEIFTKFARMGAQLGDLSSHSTKYTSPALTQKVFANMRRVGKGFSGVDTPLFKGMLVAQEVGKGADEVHVENVNVAGVAVEGAAGGIIANIDADEDVVLEDAKDVVAENPAGVEESTNDQGRQAESQAQIYKIDLEHAKKVLSMYEEESEPAEFQKVVVAVTTAKIITKVVTTASDTIAATSTTITAADASNHSLL